MQNSYNYWLYGYYHLTSNGVKLINIYTRSRDFSPVLMGLKSLLLKLFILNLTPLHLTSNMWYIENIGETK